MRRLTPDDYYREALTVLGDHGSEAMTIALLCERLGTTKGSFYHHFASLSGFVSGLLDHWESEHSDRLIAASRSQPDLALRIEALIDFAVGLPHAPEAAIRAWGRSSSTVADMIARVDRRRERHFTDSISAMGIERARARLLSRMVVNVLVGTQQREQPVELKRLRLMLDEIRDIVFGEAEPDLVDRAVAARA